MRISRWQRYCLDRLREASTWRGFILLATALGASISPDRAEAIITAGLGLAGLLAAVLPDRSP